MTPSARRTLALAIVVAAAGATHAVACGYTGAASAADVAEGGDATPSGPSDGGADGDMPEAAPSPYACSSPGLQAGAPWPMIGGCVGHQGRTAFRGPRKQPVQSWEKDLGKSYRPMPSIGADGTVYVPVDTDGVRAFAADGSNERQIATGGRDVTNVLAIGADGILYFGAAHDAVAAFLDGGQRSFDMGDEVDSSPLLDAQGNAYFASNHNFVVSLDPSGKKRWEHNAGANITSSPAIGPAGIVYVGVRDNALIAIQSTDGARLWRFPTGGDTQSSPVVADDGTIYVGTLSQKLHALNPDGTLKWTYPLPGPVDWQVLPALAADGTIYVPNGTKVTALTPGGMLKWTFESGGAIHSSAVVDPDGVIYFAGDNELGFAITPEGKELWRVAVGDPPWGLAIGRDGTIYYTCQNNSFIHAFHE